MKIKVDFSKKLNLLNNINDFPFDLVYNIMDSVNWSYYDSSSTPSTERTKSVLCGLMNSARAHGSSATGGFDVTYNNDIYNVKFIGASFVYNNLSDIWDNEDMIHFNKFIDHIYIISNRLNSFFNDFSSFSELSEYMKNKCDNFLHSGVMTYQDINYSYVINRDINTNLCEINFVVINKNFVV